MSKIDFFYLLASKLNYWTPVPKMILQTDYYPINNIKPKKFRKKHDQILKSSEKMTKISENG